MALETEYQLRDLHRVDFHAWPDVLLSLGERASDIIPLFGVEGLESCIEPANKPESGVSIRTQCLYLQEYHDNEQRDAGVNPVSCLDTRSTISAAIEVKFLIPVCRYSVQADMNHNHLDNLDCCYQDSELLNRQTYESVANTIAAMGQYSVTLHGILSTGYQEADFWDTHWIVKRANSAEPTPAEEAQGKSLYWVPVEVCSPKLHLGQSGGEAPLQTIASVLKAIKSRHRAVTNYTCDVHVHTGRTDGRALSLTTLKRLATILWLSEDLIRGIRNPASPNFQNIYTWGAEMKQHSRLAKILDSERHGISATGAALASTPALMPPGMRDSLSCSTAPRDLTSAIAAIWQATSHLELGKLLSGPTRQFRRLGFNFSSLGEEDDRARTGPRTVEFRVLEGTLDEDIVCAWVTMCWKLVAISGDAVNKPWEDEDYARAVQYCFQAAEHDENGTAKHDKESRILRSGLRGLMVGCLGVEGGVYDAFVRALLHHRAKDWHAAMV